MISHRRSSLLTTLIFLTLLSLLAQLSFFIAHYHSATLIDSLISSSIGKNLISIPILLPILAFILVQILAYVLFISFVWFITVNSAAALRYSSYYLGIFLWLMSTTLVFSLNNYYFSHSFFANKIPYSLNTLLLTMSGILLLVAVILSYYQVIFHKQQRPLGVSFIVLLALLSSFSVYTRYQTRAAYHPLVAKAKPNIIFIGLDSVRPDFTSYYGHPNIQTPNIDNFLRTALNFKDAYTPLARTFPSWMSILTGKYPKNNHARINLMDSTGIITNDNLAWRLKAAGYETIYATDEKRFSNITTAYGFDRIIGPQMGLNDFILGSSISDFPLSNLLMRLSLGKILFPYNYANRAAAITYNPDDFLALVNYGLNKRSDKPLFLAIHFCISHWPYTWAQDQQNKNLSSDLRYARSIEKVDFQLAKLLETLKEDGLLENAFVVLLSDHGTTLGLVGDRIIDKKNYQGDVRKLKWLSLFKFNKTQPQSLDFEKNYGLNTSYGQGTDLLSLKQNQVLLAIKGFGTKLGAREFTQRVSVLDLAPTILDLLELPPLTNIDGLSLKSQFSFTNSLPLRQNRPLFFETGYSFAEVETNNIEVEKILKKTIGLYAVNPQNGNLYIRPAVEKSILDSKQRSILKGDWLLVRYPDLTRTRMTATHNAHQDYIFEDYIQKAYYVLVNIKTGQWGIGFKSPLAKKAPLLSLKHDFDKFYGEEI